jgi:predicted DsbA family dithiol-disulfide isomerase
MSKSPLPIDVVSDVVCPWCYIGKRRLERAIALTPDIPVTVRFNPYFLNPWVPREGMSRADYLTTKFGSVGRYKDIAKRVAAAAADEGLVYELDKIARQPNTLDCHRLILWAGDADDAARMKQRLMELYFAEGADLSDPEVLVAAAVAGGLDGERIRSLLASDTDVARVEQAANAAKEAGIDGVPCFVLAGMLAVSGAQAPEFLADAIRRAAAERAESEMASAK